MKIVFAVVLIGIAILSAVPSYAALPELPKELWNLTNATTTASLTIQGTGGGQINSKVAELNCATVTPGTPITCNVIVDTGTIPTFMASPDATSVFMGWEGDCAPAGTANCSIYLAGSINVITARFDLQKPARIDPVYYDSVLAAYTASGIGTIVQLLEGVRQESVDYTLPVTVTLRGGYDSYYSSNSGGMYTILAGRQRVRTGKVIFDRVKVR